MTRRQKRARLRAKFDAAWNAWQATRSIRWKAEVDRLNLALLRISRPVKA
jgi:hypothetical protein